MKYPVLLTVLELLLNFRRMHPKIYPSKLAIVLLLAFGVTGIVLRLGSMWAQSFLVQRAMGMGELADYAMTTSIVSGVTGLLHPLIQMGTLLGAAWLWQSRRGAEAVITE